MRRLIIVVLFVAAGAAAWLFLARPEDRELLKTSKEALGRGDFEGAIRDAKRIPSGSRHASAARMVEGEASQRLERLDEAVALYRQIPISAPEYLAACSVAGDVRLHQGRLDEAEAFWRGGLQTNPESSFIQGRLTLVLGLEGRRWEALPMLHSLIKRGESSPQVLLMAGDVDHLLDIEKELQRCRDVAPEDPGPMLGFARIRIREGKTEEARKLLEVVRERRPQWTEGWVQSGLLAAEGDAQAFSTWLSAASKCPGIEDHPGYWLARARWEERQGEERQGEEREDRAESRARCLWEAARRHPNSVTAHYQLGQLLKAMQRESDAKPFLARAAQLEQLAAQLTTIYEGATPEGMLEAARLFDSLGRPWEAWAWTKAAYESDSKRLEPLKGVVAKMERVLREAKPAMDIPEASPAQKLDLSSFSLPSDSAGEPKTSARPKETSPVANRNDGRFRFTDDAAAAGLDFTYFNSGDPATEGMRMFEFTGGGVGAADYDRDGWPDLYFTQGVPFPAAEHPAAVKPTDELFRNGGDGRFRRVTHPSGLVEEDYGQGLAWGDLNNDGFADLYVGNIGPNRLWQNNGDGTFSDLSPSLSDRGREAWTTSVLMADLGGDGVPDLYAANYLAGKDVYTRLCPKGGVPRSCPPTAFDAADDSYQESSGAGEWLERTVEAHLAAPNGNGLGLLAADFDNDRRLDLFVANDAVPNFFFVRNTETHPATFREQAFESGLAVDGEGKPQACMGVAADDLDGNGLVDLFVTNFYVESNTFYQNLGALLFRDATPDSGLRKPSYSMLGFGTQAFDADLDGAPDLVVTNGHVDDFRHIEIPFRMPPQFYANDGAGRFHEVSKSSLGPHFEKEVLGRGLALLDWNRDGLDDFAVSHLDTPASLVTNRTEPRGKSLTIELIGTTSPRVPFGARVEVLAGGKTRTRQLTAGGGYQASNSVRMVFGLGDAARIDSVRIHWPSGLTEEIGADPGAELTVVEGSARGLLAARP